eukprot:1154628-Pelagomonas_calceolata.AAC.7
MKALLVILCLVPILCPVPACAPCIGSHWSKHAAPATVCCYCYCQNPVAVAQQERATLQVVFQVDPPRKCALSYNTPHVQLHGARAHTHTYASTHTHHHHHHPDGIPQTFRSFIF